MTCSGDNGDCPKPVEKGDLCYGHRWRKKMGKPINTPLREYGDILGTVQRAIQAVAEASAEVDEEYDRASARFRMAVLRRFRKLERRKANNLPRPSDS